jgi:anti-anti-sigma factor
MATGSWIVPFIGDPRVGFEVRSHRRRHVDVILLRGDLGLGSVPQLQPALEEAVRGRGAVVIDLVDVSFMDAQGLYALLVLRARLQQRSRALAIVCHPRSPVGTTFEVSGTDDVFSLFTSRRAALAAARRSAR